jgi:hypothetical protein
METPFSGDHDRRGPGPSRLKALPNQHACGPGMDALLGRGRLCRCRSRSTRSPRPGAARPTGGCPVRSSGNRGRCTARLAVLAPEGIAPSWVAQQSRSWSRNAAPRSASLTVRPGGAGGRWCGLGVNVLGDSGTNSMWSQEMSSVRYQSIEACPAQQRGRQMRSRSRPCQP